MKLSKVLAVAALIIFICAIIGKIAFDMNPVILACIGGGVIAASVLVDKK